MGGEVLKFVEVESELYLLSSNKLSNNKKVSVYSYLTLVRANKDDFTNRQVKRADTAWLFRRYLGYQGYRKYFKLLESNYFRNYLVTVDDAKRSLYTYDPDIEGLKGNSVRKRLLPITELDTVDIPDTLKDLHPTINLSADYFLIQGIAFLQTISRGYEFRTVECITDVRKQYKKSKMLKGIRKCINVYHSRNLRVTQLNADNEFACIEDEMRSTKMNVVAAGEHVGGIERSNRIVQEGTRQLIHTNPYERYPRIMVKGCAIKSVKNLNRLPSTNGISSTLSPSTLITGEACLDFKDVSALNFGSYVQLHRNSDTTNTPKARTVGVITLYDSGNAQGGEYLCH